MGAGARRSPRQSVTSLSQRPPPSKAPRGARYGNGLSRARPQSAGVHGHAIVRTLSPPPSASACLGPRRGAGAVPTQSRARAGSPMASRCRWPTGLVPVADHTVKNQQPHSIRRHDSAFLPRIAFVLSAGYIRFTEGAWKTAAGIGRPCRLVHDSASTETFGRCMCGDMTSELGALWGGVGTAKHTSAGCRASEFCAARVNGLSIVQNLVSTRGSVQGLYDHSEVNTN